MTAKDLTVNKIRNFEKYTFKPTAAVQNGDTMLTLSAAGGFGELSSDGSAVKVKWTDVTADPSALLAGGAGLQGKNSITLLKTVDGAANLHFDGYAATAKADGTYETLLHTAGNAADTAALLLDVNRYRDSHVTTDQDADSDLYGGYSASDHTDAGQTIGHTTSGNTLSVTRIASGKNINAYGGYTGGTAGGAENNKLIVNVTAAGAGTINNAYGGYTKGAGAVKGNQLTFSQGATLGDLIGGYADSAAHAAEVTGNTVIVTGGSVGGVVYGAKSRGTGRVSGNGVLVDSAAATADTLTGGYGASAERNRVELKDGTAHTVYGGDATTGDAVWNNVTITGGTVTDNIYGGQSLSGAANDNTVDIGAVHIQNGAANKAVVGGYASAVTDHNTIHLRGTEIDGIVLGGAIPDSTSPLGMKANPNGKGNTLAIHAASADKLRSALGVKNGDFALWAAQSGSALRLNSGSHIDVKGWNLNLGFARQKTAAHNTLTYGPFIEYGRGSYDSYLDDGTHGDGTVSYVGAGVMAKAKTSGGSYVEGSVRVGRAKSDDMSNIAGQRTGYDMSSTYYGAHIGVGQEKQTAGGTLDTYAKYFYTHQSGGSERLTTGETYDFDDVDSSRLRIGTRWTKKTLAGAFYTGLAYEYEFGSDARASYAGYGTPTPTLKGSTGLFELGYRFARPDSNVSYGVNLTGMMGKRRGITGSMQVNWAL